MICPECGSELDSVVLYRCIHAEERWSVDDNGDGTYDMHYSETKQENGDDGAVIHCPQCYERLYDLEHAYPADGETIPVRYGDPGPDEHEEEA